MRKTIRIVIGTILAALLASSYASCVTAAEVKSIVSDSNAAMVSPTLDQAGKAASDGWKAAVERIDKLIANHSDQPALVNTLRVRQAMLLTVHRHPAAKEVWKLAGSEGLNQRDQVLRE